MNDSNHRQAIITTVVDCLRHGEVDGGGRFHGSSDIPLTANGWHQMVRQCQGGQWDWVQSSPLRRCWEFAEDLASCREIASQRHTAWSEIDFGEWEGRSAAEIEQIFPGQLERFYLDPTSQPSGHGESYQAFSARVLLAWKDLLSNYSGKKLLLVTHAGPIRVLLTDILQLSPAASFHIDVPYACMTRFTCFHDGDNRFIQLTFHNPL